jgi:hypothetical protein
MLNYETAADEEAIQATNPDSLQYRHSPFSFGKKLSPGKAGGNRVSTSVLIELDKWDERGKVRAARLEDGAQISIGLRTNGNNKIVFSRSIQLGNYCFTVFVGEYRNERSFLVRASAAVATAHNDANPPKKQSSRRKPIWRERPLKPSYDEIGEVYWPIDRTGVFADFPAQWDDYWASLFIKETLDTLRSPEAPKNYEIHTDTPGEF